MDELDIRLKQLRQGFIDQYQATKDNPETWEIAPNVAAKMKSGKSRKKKK